MASKILFKSITISLASWALSIPTNEFFHKEIRIFLFLCIPLAMVAVVHLKIADSLFALRRRNWRLISIAGWILVGWIFAYVTSMLLCTAMIVAIELSDWIAVVPKGFVASEMSLVCSVLLTLSFLFSSSFRLLTTRSENAE